MVGSSLGSYGFSGFRPYAGLGYGALTAGVLGARRFGMNANVGNGTNSSMVLTRRPKRRGKYKTFAQKVRNVHGYKHNTLSSSAVSNVMTHQTIYTTNLTSKIVQGDSNADRDGDSVHLTAFKLKGVIHSPTTAGAYVYRVLVGWSGEEYALTASSAGLTSAELFLPNQGGAFFATANVNPKAFTVIHDEIIDINSNITATSDLKSIAFNVPIKQKYAYQSTGSTFGKFKNLYIVVISGVVGGTSGTTASGSYFFDTDLIFQNMS